jgi:2-polyprenyl-6-methoxyphenol hydroxylase-like FAD-dependent oxidoreductase
MAKINHVRVIVVGGGITGLTLANALEVDLMAIELIPNANKTTASRYRVCFA